ncbi:hypothetical protein AVEN_208233-1 [Araneus ventricosus]|uniref:C2H2-type domain-containing protein n=1 Tax=Araneus ventricosus TaxID=182803 RepID=A0A4Y2JIB4_ARAVE|nr:hypothetical protein AVEN_162415-1 [Araneus ventricosus]GBO22024.1 hypothetical protein AVEN_208233-1 [Araneus ventricosus]
MEEAPTVPITNYSCRFCNFVYTNKRALINHESTHYPEKLPFSCPSCPKVFREKYQLQSHLYTHDSARHFKCNFCGRTFRHSSSLARHKRSHRLTLQNHNR